MKKLLYVFFENLKRETTGKEKTKLRGMGWIFATTNQMGKEGEWGRWMGMQPEWALTAAQ